MASQSNEIKSQPIGYWTGEAYRHIARAIRQSLAAANLTQPQWWMLNHVAKGEWAHDALLNKLAPFNANEQDLDLAHELDELIERGWMTHDSATQKLHLTVRGEEERQHALERNSATHRAMIAGVSEEGYDDCIRVLQRIVGNLDGDSSSH